MSQNLQWNRRESNDILAEQREVNSTVMLTVGDKGSVTQRDHGEVVAKALSDMRRVI